MRRGKGARARNPFHRRPDFGFSIGGGGNLLKGGGTVRAVHFTRLSAGANPGETLTTAQTPAPENVSARSHHDVSFRSLDNLDVRVFVFVLERRL